MHRTLSGIPFIIHSPSHYEVAAYDDCGAIASAHLHFNGQLWQLHVALKRGHTVTRDFHSLADALALLSCRNEATA